MDEYTIRQAIDLIHARRYSDARKLLRPVLEVTPTNEAAWIWFASTFSNPAEKLLVYKAGLAFCEESEPLQRWIDKCKEELDELKAMGEEPETPDIASELPQNARDLQKASEPKLELPEAGKPFEWQEPLIGKKRKQTTQTGSLFRDEQTEDQPAFESENPEAQTGDWMDSLRGTMEAGSEISALPGEDTSTIQAKLDQASRFPGEEEHSARTPDKSISKKISNIWGAITGAEDSPVNKPEVQPEKSPLIEKISGIWDKWGEEPKSEPEPEVPQVEQPFSSPFGDTYAPDDDVILHPEFFEHPQPEPEPEPYDEPVIVWGAQQIETPAEKSVSPWEIGAIAAQAPQSSLQSPASDNSFDMEHSGNNESDQISSIPDPYQVPYQIAVSIGIVLFLVVVLIFGVDFLPI